MRPGLGGSAVRTGLGGTPSSRLRDQLRRFVGRRGSMPSTVEASGASAYEQVTRRGLEDLIRDVERIELKVNGILVAVGSAVLIETFRAILK